LLRRKPSNKEDFPLIIREFRLLRRNPANNLVFSTNKNGVHMIIFLNSFKSSINKKELTILEFPI